MLFPEVHWWIQGNGYYGYLHLSVQFLSFLCSLWHKFCQNKFLPQRVGDPRLRSEGGTIGDRVFSKCTRMAIMPILASEALFRENKKIQLQNATLVSIELLDL